MDGKESPQMPGSPRTNTVPPPHMAVGTLSHRLRISAVAFALGIAALGTAWEAHAQVPDARPISALRLTSDDSMLRQLTCM